MTCFLSSPGGEGCGEDVVCSLVRTRSNGKAVGCTALQRLRQFERLQVSAQRLECAAFPRFGAGCQRGSEVTPCPGPHASATGEVVTGQMQNIFINDVFAACATDPTLQTAMTGIFAAVGDLCQQNSLFGMTPATGSADIGSAGTGGGN